MHEWRHVAHCQLSLQTLVSLPLSLHPDAKDLIWGGLHRKCVLSLPPPLPREALCGLSVAKTKRENVWGKCLLLLRWVVVKVAGELVNFSPSHFVILPALRSVLHDFMSVCEYGKTNPSWKFTGTLVVQISLNLCVLLCPIFTFLRRSFP